MKSLQFSVSVPQYLALTLLGALTKGFFYSGPLAVSYTHLTLPTNREV